jgi:hypothetical protein
MKYNQKETTTKYERAGHLNYFSRIIWFCWAKPDTAENSRTKGDWNHTEGKSRGFLINMHAAHHPCPTITIEQDWDGQTDSLPPKISMATRLPKDTQKLGTVS